MQRLMHAFKYDGNQELGAYLGQLMGQSLVLSNRFSYLDALVPLPLFKSKERTRGFNQAKILCDGIAGVLGVPILNHVVQRTVHTDSQTKKGRIERWQNMEGRFALCDGQQLEGKHILLVDDVITTGATLEACGKEIMKQNNVQVSIATLCFSSGF